MSYLVMECHPGYAILLDENGRFLRAANFCYEVGQTVYDPVLMKETQEKQNHAIQWIRGGIAAVAACLLLFLGFGYYQNYLQPYSSIYLTINPEVQMDLNRQGTVVALAGTNEDGEELIEGYNGKGKDKVTVADELIDRAINMGFLSEGGQVSFSIDTPEEVLFQEYGAELRTSVTEYLDGRIAVTIEIMNYADRQSPEPSASSTPAAKPTGSPEPVKSVTALPADSSDYGDTDYALETAERGMMRLGLPSLLLLQIRTMALEVMAQPIITIRTMAQKMTVTPAMRHRLPNLPFPQIQAEEHLIIRTAIPTMTLVIRPKMMTMTTETMMKAAAAMEMMTTMTVIKMTATTITTKMTTIKNLFRKIL